MEGRARSMACQACEIIVRARKIVVRARAGIVRASALIDRACAMSRREREMNGPRSMCVVRANSSIQGGCVGEGRNFDRVGHLWLPRRRLPRRVNRQGAENAKEGRRLFSLAFSCLVWVAVSSFACFTATGGRYSDTFTFGSRARKMKGRAHRMDGLACQMEDPERKIFVRAPPIVDRAPKMMRRSLAQSDTQESRRFVRSPQCDDSANSISS
jgi:hypothetical protein